MLINGNHQTECVCLSLICLATNWTHQYQCWQHCCSCCCSCWKRCACYVKVTDRSEQGAPLSQGAERFAALSLAQQMATRVAVAHPLPHPQPTVRDVVVYVQPLNFPCIWGIICSSPQWFSCSFFLINNKIPRLFVIVVRFTTFRWRTAAIVYQQIISLALGKNIRNSVANSIFTQYLTSLLALMLMLTVENDLATSIARVEYQLIKVCVCVCVKCGQILVILFQYKTNLNWSQMSVWHEIRAQTPLAIEIWPSCTLRCSPH